MSHHTKDKGDLAVAKTIAHLLEHNIRVCLPLSEHLPFDLIAVMPDMKTLRRVQVKYRSANEYGGIELLLRANYYNSKQIYSKAINLDAIDCFAAYCPETSEVYYLRVDELRERAKGITLRIRPAKSNRFKDVWDARLFRNPSRIAEMSKVNYFIEPRQLSEQLELAVVQVIADLMTKGWQVCVPNSLYIPFDLIAIAPDMTTLTRVCVGYETVQRNPYADQYAAYNPKTKAIRYIDANELESQDRELQNGRRHV